jgi:3-(3-hydroxy-phenyl)propionate hydroxylase
MNPDYDVVVAGYGLAGECAASLLARLGHKVAVFERWPTLYGLPRTVSFDGEGARIVSNAGDIGHALSGSSKIKRYDIRDAERRLITAMTWDENLVCGFYNRTSFYQPNVEEAMDEGARRHGAEINQGWEVASASQDADAVTLTVREHEADGEPPLDNPEERTVTARYLVGADGARSFVRETIGVDWTYFDYRDAWLSVDVMRKSAVAEIDPSVATQIIATDRVIAAIPIGMDRIRFEFLLGGEPEDHVNLSEEAGYEFLQEAWDLSRDDVEIYRQVVYPFEGRMAESWRDRRMLLAGDAAHLMPPFVGMGAVSAFRDAINLTWKVDLVLRGLTDDSLLDTYEEERRPNTQAYINIGVEIGKMSTISDPEAAAARDAAMREGGTPPPPDPEYDFGVFRHVDDVIARPAGLREPQGEVEYDGRRGRFDEVLGWGFSLVVRDVDPADHLTEAQQAFLAQIGCKVVQLGAEQGDGVVVSLDGEYDRYFAEHGVIGYLARPDFRLFAGIRSIEEIGPVVDDLEGRLLGVHA